MNATPYDPQPPRPPSAHDSTNPHVQEALRAGAAGAAEAQRIKRNPHLSDEGRKAQLSALEEATNGQIEAAKARYREEASSKLTMARVRAFGPVSADVMSLRDAAARASQLTSSPEATTLLKSALRLSDAALAREIVNVAIENRWEEPVEAFGEANPSVAKDLRLIWLDKHGPQGIFANFAEKSAFMHWNA